MSYHHLTLEERKKLSQLSENCYGIRAIAQKLGRSPSTISRELKRNACFQKGLGRAYRFIPADELYRSRIHRRRAGKYRKPLQENIYARFRKCRLQIISI